MGLLHARKAGAWVDSTQAGMVRYNGSWENFGPSGFDYEAIDWGTTPSNTDANDGSQAYNMGVEFSLVASKDIVGVQWRVPDSVVNPQGFSHNVSLWDVNSEVRLANKDFTPVPGGLQDILFDLPYAGVLSVNYIAAVYTNHYVFRSGSPAGLDSPSGNVVASSGVLVPYNSGPNIFPDGSFSSIYYVSPLVAL